MFTRLLKTILIMAAMPVLLIACGGELGDMELPSTGTYRVNAHIGKISLDECSIITEKDTIRPFFVNFVENDPDIMGLTVFLQGPNGEIPGGKVQYTIQNADTDAAAGNKNGSGNGGKAGDEKNEPDKSDSGPVNQDSPDKTDSESADTSADRAPPPSAATVTGSPAVADTVIHVSRLDRELPLFPLPKNLSTGRYTLVFQVLGKRNVLDRIERSVYYIGDAEFTLNDIQSYPPGISTWAHLVPPGLTLMLETQVIAGEGLDPYIIWYNGKKRIHEGSIAEGAGRFLWKAPDQTGFHILRAEAFPFKPASDMKGTIKELSLPVSAKNEHTRAFAKQADEFTNWYQFAGDLRDTKAASDTNNAIPGQYHSTRWIPAGGIYGLSIGPGDTFQLPLAFTYSENEQAEGQFLLRFKPVSEGTVFNAVFTGENGSPVTLDLALFTRKNGLSLGLNIGEKSISIPLPSKSLENEAFITAQIDFSIETNLFTAALSLEKSDAVPAPITIPLSAALDGKGTFRLGGGSAKDETKAPGAQKTSNSGNLPKVNDESAITAILDEFAVSYRATPLLDEVAVEDTPAAPENLPPPPPLGLQT
ncbi:hypothetical protein FACS189476_09830 [Spirochaetia bacterium]|nr:hypothetical protein FACS189476_09830 [Spirochaetia bacterium]